MAVWIRLRQVPVDVFDHYHRSVHDNAEIDRPHRDQVCRFAPNHHHDERKQQGEGNRQCDNEGCSKITQECQENKSDQDHSLEQRMRHRVCRDIDEVRPVVIGHDAHAFGENPVVELVDLLTDAPQRRERLCALPKSVPRLPQRLAAGIDATNTN